MKTVSVEFDGWRCGDDCCSDYWINIYLLENNKIISRRENLRYWGYKEDYERRGMPARGRKKAMITEPTSPPSGLASPSCSLILGDCLEVMKNLPDQSVDAIITDLPYGTTACKWDAIIPFAPMWEQVRRVLKPSGVFVTTASQPFTTALIASNLEWFKYEWIWEKSKGCNFTHAKNMPIKFHESVVVFSGGKIGHACQLGARRMTYNPQGLVKVDRPWSRPQKYENGHKLRRESHSLERIIEFEGYPRSLIKIGNSDNRERGAHPTQKPLELMRYMVRTYTNPGDVVLDPCMGSGTTCLAAKLEGRGYIGIEREPKYFETAKTRIEGDADLFSANKK